MSVGRAGVDGGDAGGGIGQQRERAMRPGGQTEVEGEAVAGAAGTMARAAGVPTSAWATSFIVPSPPTATTRSQPSCERRAGQLGGVAGTRGEDEIGVEPVAGDEFPDGGCEPGIAAVPAGTGIEDEARFHAAVMAAGAAAPSSNWAAMVRLASGRARGASAARHWLHTAPPVGEGPPQGGDHGFGRLDQRADVAAAQQLVIALLLAGDDLVDEHRAARGDGLLGGGAAGLADDHVVGHQQPGNLVGPAEDVRGPRPTGGELVQAGGAGARPARPRR